IYMEGMTGLDVLAGCLDLKPDTLVVMMTGNPSVESSIEVLAAGAWDYLPKPFSATHLHILVGRAAHQVLANRESRPAGGEPQQVLQSGRSERVPLLGRSPA